MRKSSILCKPMNLPTPVHHSFEWKVLRDEIHIAVSKITKYSEIKCHISDVLNLFIDK